MNSLQDVSREEVSSVLRRSVRVLDEYGFSDVVYDRTGIDIHRALEDVESLHDEDPVELSTADGVIHPFDERIIEMAVTELIEDRQQREISSMAFKPGDYREIPIELDMDDPLAVVYRFSKMLAVHHDSIVSYLSQVDLDYKGPSLEADSDELFSYVIDTLEDGNRSAVIIGGGKAVRKNLVDAYGVSQDEADLVRRCHQLAARHNGFGEHTLLDEVLIIPSTQLPPVPYDIQQ